MPYCGIKQKKKYKRKELGEEDRNAGIQGIPIVGRIAGNPTAKAGGLREIMKGEHVMLLWTMDQMRELQLQWARELYWQEGQARGAIRTCKAMGLDFADALQHLQALLPELPQVNAERLARYYWKEESSANAVAKIDYEIDRRTDREINRVWYGEEYCKSFDEGYINGAVKALAGVIKDYGISLNDSCLQDEADSLNLSLGELRETGCQAERDGASRRKVMHQPCVKAIWR